MSLHPIIDIMMIIIYIIIIFVIIVAWGSRGKQIRLKFCLHTIMWTQLYKWQINYLIYCFSDKKKNNKTPALLMNKQVLISLM